MYIVFVGFKLTSLLKMFMQFVISTSLTQFVDCFICVHMVTQSSVLQPFNQLVRVPENIQKTHSYYCYINPTPRSTPTRMDVRSLPV